MPRASTIKTNFTGGELSPRLEGRVDLQKYLDGAKSIKNMVVFPHGGVARRGGTRFVCAVKTSSKATILIPFEFSVTQAYILEFGDLYVRFYKDQACITSGVTTGPFSSDFSSDFDRSGTDVPVEVVTPYTAAQLSGLKFAQSADQLFICHPSHEPMVLSRLSDISWTLAEITFLDGPYLTQNITATTLTPGAATGTGITITASSIVGINGGLGFQTTDIGRFIRIIEGSDFGYAKITARASTTSVTVTILDDFVSTGAQTTWRLGSWSDTTGFPGTVTFHEERLWFAGTTNDPQTLWASETADFFNHAPGANASNPLVYTIASNQVNTIRWLSAGKALLIGTAKGEFLASGSSLETAMTPSNVRIVRQSNHGSSNISAIQVANQTLFVQRSGRKVRQLIWNFDQDSFIAPDLTLISEHITETNITDIAYQQEPDSIVWCILTNGKLIGLTYELEQNVFAWHQHQLGGKSDQAGSITKVESIAVIPSSSSTPREELWMVVNRTINDVTERYVEVLTGGLETTEDQKLSFFVDSGLSLNVPITITGATKANPVVITAAAHGLLDGGPVRIDDIAGMTEINSKQFTVANKTTNTFELSGEDGTAYTTYISGGEARAAVTTISGLDHLEEETVSVLVDGGAHPNRQVISGSITLQSAAAVVHVGLPYTSEVETLRIEGGSADGTSQGKTKTLGKMRYRFNRTLGCKHGPTRDRLTTLNFRNTSDRMDAAPSLFSDDFEIEFPRNWDKKGTIILQQDQPLPLTVLAIMAEVSTND